jgi:hypothetical protein
MPTNSSSARIISLVGLYLVACLALPLAVVAQSQEPKPSTVGTPAAEEAVADSTGQEPVTGVLGASWQSPTWGVQLDWDADIWSVENEQIDEDYEGLQIGTEHSTVYVEAFARFDGNADDCLADAEREIAERDRVSEVVPISGRPLPDTGDAPGPARLFGVVATLPDGEAYRGVEFVECRTIVPGLAVLELTWQTTVGRVNDELPLVSALLSSIQVPQAVTPELGAATPISAP